MNIHGATRSYEAWMRRCTVLVQSDLTVKHSLMRKDPIGFFRGTYYRWAQLWTDIDIGLRRAPLVIAVGDLHVDSFGTWRDAEGRLAWGVDDFDEAYPLPYTNDLVRLAASVKMARDAGLISLGLRAGCDAILDGYRHALRAGGQPIVLAEVNEGLEKLGIREFEPPEGFWEKLNDRPAMRRGVPVAARRALTQSLPERGLPYKIVRRQAGTGSLGQRRFVAVAQWAGACVAREAKAVVPSSGAWLSGRVSGRQPYYNVVMRAAVRAPDPYQRVVSGWLVRRLSPDSNPIEIASLPAKRDEGMLLHAMGTEAANVHVGRDGAGRRILADIGRRHGHWLRDAAKHMTRAVERDWKEYRRG
jgi:uncharacterized protein (DUF2252 family)